MVKGCLAGVNSKKTDCLNGVKKKLTVVFFFCGGAYRKWKPIDARQRTGRLLGRGRDIRSKPDPDWGSIFLARIWATWRPTQAFIGGKNCMNTVALEKFSFFMK